MKRVRRIHKNDFSIPTVNLVLIGLCFALIVAVGITVISFTVNSHDGSTTDITGLHFSEVMTSNSTAYKAPNGELYDWFELANGSDTDMDLTGCSVTAPDGTTTYVFENGTVIKAHGYLVVFCGGKTQNGLYTGFNLAKAGGQTLVLHDKDGKDIDTLHTVPLDSDTVYRRTADGTFEESAEFTPGFANTAEGRTAYLASLSTVTAPEIVISELMAQNRTVITDEDGDYVDFIEITNISDKTVDLLNYSLSNDASERYQWNFPSLLLGPGESTVVFASGKDRAVEGEELHANFKLRETGETVLLCRADGQTLSTVTYKNLAAGSSYERLEDGTYTVTYTPTPFYANNEAGREAAAKDRDKHLGSLVIWEAMSKNTAFLATNGGRYYDWVELKNVGSEPINLGEYCLSSDPDDLSFWALPDKTLQPGDTYLVLCSGSEALSNSTYTHTSFKINGDEELFLTKDGTIVDALCLKATEENVSMGRIDGQNGFFYMPNPTPKKANNATGAYRAVTSAPEVLTAQGVYNDTSSLTVFLDGEGTITYSVYYAADGGKESLRQDGLIYDRTAGITLTSTAVIRATSKGTDKGESAVTYASYILNENHTLPVVSVTLSYDDMWDYYTGIYVEGPNASSEIPHKGANYWQDWEKSATISLFAEGEDGFSLACGIKIFGAYSRMRDKKSFLIKFRDLYGAGELNYDVFGSEIKSFESLVLRSGSQDDDSAMVRDEWLTSLAASTSDAIYVQDYRPVVLYINGAYFGVYYIREKIDDDYVSKHLNVSRDSVNLLESNYYVIDGSNVEYKDLLNYVKTHDMSKKEHYEYVCARMDVVSYIDYKIAEIFSGNQDTGNIKYFMSKDADGKWHWILFDLDWAFYYYTSIDFYLTRQRSGFAELNTLSKYLLNNDEFVDLFLTRFAYHMKNTYNYDHSVGMLEELVATIEPEMERNCERWGNKYARWVSYVNELKTDVMVKTGMQSYKGSYQYSLYNAVKEFFHLSDSEYATYFGDAT